MAKAPSKRRGITLGSRADKAIALDLLSVPPPPSLGPESDPPSPAPEVAVQRNAPAAPMMAQLDTLRCLNAELDSRWREQSEQIERQRHQLEQQRDAIARQTRALLALEQRRVASSRVGALLALLTLVGVAALGLQGWPWLRGVAEDVNRVSSGVAALAPQLQAMRGQMAALSVDPGPVDSAMAALREDVAGVRSDLGALRRTVDTLSEAKGALPAKASDLRSTANTRPHNATTMTGPYWSAPPVMRW